MIDVRNLSYRYPKQESPALRDINVTIERGMFLTIVGHSGSGKSTLLRSLNGLVPHFHGGSIAGYVLVAGTDTRSSRTADLSRIVGFVSQDPETQSVFDTVVDDVAFGPENLHLSRSVLLRQVDTALDRLGIQHLRDRDISTLSGGERQRVAIASVIAMGSRVLVLDEPLSQLDPWAARDLIQLLKTLNREQGVALVVAEHRLDRLMRASTHVVELNGGRQTGEPGQLPAAAARLQTRPALAELANLLEWPHIPSTPSNARAFVKANGPRITPVDRARGSVAHLPAAIEMHDVGVRIRQVEILDGVSLAIRQQSITAIMGKNGSGKSTLLRAIAGLQPVQTGRLAIHQRTITDYSDRERARIVGFVPQHPAALFLGETVSEEVQITLNARKIDRDVREILIQFGLEHLRDRYSYDISGGERQRLALATVMAGEPEILLLDEPTRGMDLPSRRRLISIVRSLGNAGTTVVIATHDSELAAAVADHLVLLDQGRVEHQGDPRSVLARDPALMTDVALTFGPEFVSVDDVQLALDARRNVHSEASRRPVETHD